AILRLECAAGERTALARLRCSWRAGCGRLLFTPKSLRDGGPSNVLWPQRLGQNLTDGGWHGIIALPAGIGGGDQAGAASSNRSPAAKQPARQGLSGWRRSKEAKQAPQSPSLPPTSKTK